MTESKEVLIQRGIGAILSSMGGGNPGSGNTGDGKKPLPKVNVPKPTPTPPEKQGFDVNSTVEFTGWGDLNPESAANTEGAKKNAGEQQKDKKEKEEKEIASREEGHEQSPPVHRGVGALLSNLSVKNFDGGNKRQQQQQPPKVNRQSRQPQKKGHFDLNSGSEFSSWGDISEGTGGGMYSGMSGPSAEPVKHPAVNQRRNSYHREDGNMGRGGRRKNFGFQENSLMGEYPGQGMGATNKSWSRQPPREGNANRGFKRDVPEGLARQNKRYRQEKDYDIKEMSNWSDTLKYNNDEESSYRAAENRRLAEEYGGSFVTVKILKDQGGKMGYYCELCFVEMNEKKTLDLHCSGMKHLKKKNQWEKTKRKSIDGSLEDMGKTGMDFDSPGSDGPRPQLGRLLPPAAFREDSSKYPLEPDCSGRQNHDYFRRQGCDYPGYQGRQECDYPGFQEHNCLQHEEKTNQYERKGYSRRDDPTASDKPGNTPSRGTNFSKPPPVSAPPRQHLSGETAGPLLKKLAESAVIHEDDANVATDVISMLLESLKEFHEKNRTPSTVHMISEAELKFNIVVELEKAAQLGRVSFNKNRPQNKPAKRDNSNKSQMQSEPVEKANSSRGNTQSEPQAALESPGTSNTKNCPKQSSPAQNYNSVAAKNYSSSTPSYTSGSKSYSATASTYTSAPPSYTSAPPSYASAPPNYTSAPPGYTTAPPGYSSGTQGYSSTGGYSSVGGYNSASQNYSTTAQGYGAAPMNFNSVMHPFNPAAGFFNYPPVSGQSLFTAPPPPPPPPATPATASSSSSSSSTTYGYKQ